MWGPERDPKDFGVGDLYLRERTAQPRILYAYFAIPDPSKFAGVIDIIVPYVSGAVVKLSTVTIFISSRLGRSLIFRALWF